MSDTPQHNHGSKSDSIQEAKNHNIPSRLTKQRYSPAFLEFIGQIILGVLGAFTLGLIGWFYSIGNAVNIRYFAIILLIEIVLFGYVTRLKYRHQPSVIPIELSRDVGEIKKLLEIKNREIKADPHISIENISIGLTADRTPLVTLQILNDGLDTAYDFFVTGYCVTAPASFNGIFDYESKSIGEPFNLPVNTKMSADLEWRVHLSVEDQMRIVQGTLLQFVYLETSYKNAAGELVSFDVYNLVYSPPQRALIIAPTKYWAPQD